MCKRKAMICDCITQKPKSPRALGEADVAEWSSA